MRLRQTDITQLRQAVTAIALDAVAIILLACTAGVVDFLCICVIVETGMFANAGSSSDCQRSRHLDIWRILPQGRLSIQKPLVGKLNQAGCG